MYRKIAGRGSNSLRHRTPPIKDKYTYIELYVGTWVQYFDKLFTYTMCPQVCVNWYPCGLKYCKGKPQGGLSYRCGIKTCRRCYKYHYYVRRKDSCIWDEWHKIPERLPAPFPPCQTAILKALSVIILVHFYTFNKCDWVKLLILLFLKVFGDHYVNIVLVTILP